MIKKVKEYFKGDIVLTAAGILALLSCFLVPPSREYLSYIDFNTIILLFCLMLIMEGLKELKFFPYIGTKLLGRVKSSRGIVFTLFFLCFFSSMLITNDVALITFVPFGILILQMTGMTHLLCSTVTYMTIAGNLGSMLTPVGNPQNLYLYALSGMGFVQFIGFMLPYAAVSGILLALVIAVGKKQPIAGMTSVSEEPLNGKKIGFYLFLFLLSILSVAGFIPKTALLVCVGVCVLLADRHLFCKVDYALLLTFICFFIFIGNAKHLENLQQGIIQVLHGQERLVSIGVSQIISNVPAAVLLSGYTDNIKELLIGTNLGGLGTLIASMASLISYKQIAAQYPQLKQKYFAQFTLYNVLFLAVLYGFSVLYAG